MNTSVRHVAPKLVRRTESRTDACASPSDDVFLSQLGKCVRELRGQRGLARKALAEKADVSERYLAQVETGSGNVSVVLLRRIADALGIDMAHLLRGEVAEERARVDNFINSLAPRRLPDLLQRLIDEYGTDGSVRRKRVALIGLRGAGKSTLGRALAKTMRRPFIELDREIERDSNLSLPEIFQMYGPAGYRSREHQCLEKVIASQNEIVLSVGGGLVLERASLQLLLKNCFTVWIKASPAEHMARVVAQGDLRPIRGRTEAMAELRGILAAREPLYARADAVVDTTRQPLIKSINALREIVSPRR